MRKLIKFKPNAQTYYDIAEQKYEDGDFDSAVHYFYKSYEQLGDINSLLALGETYCEIGEPEEGLKYLHMALDLQPDDIEICHSIAQCFLDMDDEETAFFYFQPGMNMDSFRHMMDEESQEEPRHIRMLEKNDDMVVNIAVKLFDSGDIAYAREILLTVKPDSEYYVSANNLLALSAMELKKPEEAIDFAEKALSVRENIDSRCNMMLAYHMMDDAENMLRLSGLIEAQKPNLAGHKTVSLAYIRMGDAEKAAYHLKSILDIEKFNRDALVSYALANYNLNLQDEAKQIIVRAGRLFPADIAIREIAAAMSRGDKLSLFPLLNDETATDWMAEIDSKLASAKEHNNDFYADELFKDKIKWLFQSRLSIRQSRAAMILGRSSKWRDFFCEQLLDNYMDLSAKKICLLAHLLRGDKGEVGIVIDGMYCRLKVKFPANMDDIFNTAYCIAFSSFAFSDSGFEARLYTTTKKLLKQYSLIENKEVIKSEDALAAAIFFAAKHRRIEGTVSCAHLFGCEHDELIKYLDFFGIKTGKM